MPGGVGVGGLCGPAALRRGPGGRARGRGRGLRPGRGPGWALTSAGREARGRMEATRRPRLRLSRRRPPPGGG